MTAKVTECCLASGLDSASFLQSASPVFFVICLVRGDGKGAGSKQSPFVLCRVQAPSVTAASPISPFPAVAAAAEA